MAIIVYPVAVIVMVIVAVIVCGRNCTGSSALLYCTDVYRGGGGGGIPRDGEYGYSKDFRCPPIGHFQLNPPAGKAASPQADDVTDMAVLRRKFRVRSYYLTF